MNCHLIESITEYQHGLTLKRFWVFTLISVLFFTALIPAEVSAAPDPKSEKFVEALQKRFNTFPQLRQYGFRVKVLSFSEGILTLTTSKLPETKSATRRANIKSIWKKLIGISERLAKSYTEVKTVVWIDQINMVAPTVAPMTPTEKTKKKGAREEKEEQKPETEEKKIVVKPSTNFSGILAVRNMGHDYWKSPSLTSQNTYGISVDHQEKNWKVGVVLDMTYSTATTTESGIDYVTAVTAIDIGARKSWFLKDILIPSLSVGGSIVQTKEEGLKKGVSQGQIKEFYYGYFYGTSMVFYFEGLSIGATLKQVAGTTSGFGDHTMYGAIIGYGF